MKPIFLCDYPCSTCSTDDRTLCTTCWKTPDTPNFLMSYPDTVPPTATCKSYCDFGSTTNGNTDKEC